MSDPYRRKPAPAPRCNGCGVDAPVFFAYDLSSDQRWCPTCWERLGNRPVLTMLKPGVR